MSYFHVHFNIMNWIFTIDNFTMFCSVSGKITRTTRWNRGHIFAFRLLCIKPRARGRTAPTFHPARNRRRHESFLDCSGSAAQWYNVPTSSVSGGLGKLYMFVFHMCSARGELQPLVVLSVILNSITTCVR